MRSARCLGVSRIVRLADHAKPTTADAQIVGKNCPRSICVAALRTRGVKLRSALETECGVRWRVPLTARTLHARPPAEQAGHERGARLSAKGAGGQGNARAAFGYNDRHSCWTSRKHALKRWGWS